MNKYIIDTSSLIELKDKYPRDIFKSLWTNLENLINERRIQAPKQVYEEIKRQEDELTNFIDNHKQKLFIDIDNDKEIMEEFGRIIRDYPRLIDHRKEDGDCADPYIIALAKIYTKRLNVGRIIVVTEDRKNKGKISIKYVCNEENITCITLIELFREEGWEF